MGPAMQYRVCVQNSMALPWQQHSIVNAIVISAFKTKKSKLSLELFICQKLCNLLSTSCTVQPSTQVVHKRSALNNTLQRSFCSQVWHTESSIIQHSSSSWITCNAWTGFTYMFSVKDLCTDNVKIYHTMTYHTKCKNKFKLHGTFKDNQNYHIIFPVNTRHLG